MSKLKECFELIKDPDRWFQGYYARNFDGILVKAWDKTACSFCISGAQKVYHFKHKSFGLNKEFSTDLDILRNYAISKGYPNLVSFNDSPKTTHQDILEMGCSLGVISNV